MANSAETASTSAAPVGASPAATHEVSDAPAERGASGGDPAARAAQDLTPEFADIAAQLSAAFGQPLSVSVEPAATTSDEEAAEELSYEEGQEEDAGFIDEPVDDSEDDEEND